MKNFNSYSVLKQFFIFIFLLYSTVEAQQSFAGTVNLGKSSSGTSIANTPQYGSVTGYQVNDLGDFNGDGYGDIGIQSNCSFYVVYGSYYDFSADLSSLTTESGFSITGEGIVYGCALQTMAAIGDINGDKFSDFFIGVSGFGTSIAPLYYVILGALSTNNINLDDLSNNPKVLTILGPWAEGGIESITSFPSSMPTSPPSSYPTPSPTGTTENSEDSFLSVGRSKNDHHMDMKIKKPRKDYLSPTRYSWTDLLEAQKELELLIQQKHYPSDGVRSYNLSSIEQEQFLSGINEEYAYNYDNCPNAAFDIRFHYIPASTFYQTIYLGMSGKFILSVCLSSFFNRCL
jgi:hypothetical protein